MKKQRWQRLNKIKKRRVNYFALEQAVKKLAADNANFRELSILDSEQVHDLLQSLDKRVKNLQAEVERLEAKQKTQAHSSVWQKVKSFFVGP